MAEIEPITVAIVVLLAILVFSYDAHRCRRVQRQVAQLLIGVGVDTDLPEQGTGRCALARTAAR